MTRFDPLRFVQNKFLRDTATLQVSSIINKVSQVASSVLIAVLLGAEGQGLFVLALSLQALLFNLLNVGVLQATISQVAAAAARSIDEKVTQWLAFLVKAYLTINAAIIVVAYFALPAAAERWYGSHELGIWAWWLCFFPFIDTIRVAVFAALQGTRRMLLVAQLDNSSEIVRVFLVIIGALLTGSPAGAVMGEIAARVLWIPIALSQYAAARRDGAGYLPSVGQVLRAVPGVSLRRGLHLGLRVGFLKNSHTMFIQVVPQLVLGNVAGASWVAWFTVAKRFMDLPMMLMQGVTRTFLPALSEVAGLRDTARFKRLFTRVTLASGGSVMIGLIAFLPLLKPLVRFFYPSDYEAPVMRYALILALGYLPAGFAVGLESFYMVTNQMKRSMLLMFFGGLVTIPLFFVLIVALPETGAAWGHSLYFSWSLVHYVYIVWYFKTRRHETMWPVPDAQPPSDEAGVRAAEAVRAGGAAPR